MKDIIELSITPDAAAKLVMSAGLIQPEAQAALAGAAAAAVRPEGAPAPETAKAGS